MNWLELEARISDATQATFCVQRSVPVAGGSINSAHVLEGAGKKYFVKLNAKSCTEMFAAEAEGLAELAKPGVIRVPQPICWGELADRAFIVMEHIPLSRGDQYSAFQFGKQLASLHRVSAERFGWHRDNTIGSTPQINRQDADWVSFFREQRLQYQFSLGARNGCGREVLNLGEILCENLAEFFHSYQPQPSLLHGDLWSGNYAYDESSTPVIFDPAVYYGDREADIAMTELFGGFSSEFYEGYNHVFPLDDGYPLRKNLYNLYHIINHMNLFGGGYARQAVGMMKKLLSEI
ncbi:MAG TPA: fructosamine kinase family protein [Gammaproteobacteria bacterium]|nr:fructosamine kinase family protein [Gammaproteobacteria bacterium]